MEQIYHLIAQGKLALAIDKAVNEAQTTLRKNAFRNLQARLKTIESAWKSGTVTRDEYFSGKNRIREALLTALDPEIPTKSQNKWIRLFLFAGSVLAILLGTYFAFLSPPRAEPYLAKPNLKCPLEGVDYIIPIADFSWMQNYSSFSSNLSQQIQLKSQASRRSVLPFTSNRTIQSLNDIPSKKAITDSTCLERGILVYGLHFLEETDQTLWCYFDLIRLFPNDTTNGTQSILIKNPGGL
ncbi:MAG: hypothetical protein AAF570_15775, partial [Bacteroidota bacterium]